MRVAKETGLLLVIGTSGATNLPMQIVETTLKRQGKVIDINPNENEFTNKLERVKNGYSIRSISSEFLEEFYNLLWKGIKKEKRHRTKATCQLSLNGPTAGSKTVGCNERTETE